VKTGLVPDKKSKLTRRKHEFEIGLAEREALKHAKVSTRDVVRNYLFHQFFVLSIHQFFVLSLHFFRLFIFFLTGIAQFGVSDECIKRLFWVYWLLILEQDYFWLLSNRGLFYSVRVREACDRHFFPHGFEVEGVLGRAR